MHRAVFILLAAACAPLFAAEEPAPAEIFTAKEIAQGFSDRVIFAKPRAARRAESDSEEKREGRRVRRHWDRFGGLRLLEVREGETVAQARERLMATGRYEFVHPDTILRVDATPNDPSFARQWGLANNGANNGIVGADIRATEAWDVRTDASNVIVAVIDSGVRLTHPDIVDNLWRNPREIPGNGIDDDGNGYIDDVHGINAITRSGNPADDLGHGTHVAGIIGATGNNGTGVAGVAWRVQIMPLKFLRAGTGIGFTSDQIVCIDYAIAHGAKIINASYGAASDSITQFDPVQFDAMRRLRDAGIIVVAAAGNSAADMDVRAHYPASFQLENVIAVGNSANRDDISPSSNYGSGSVELFAPGSDIYSLAYDTTLYTSKTGTSMAAPHVVGALALLRAHFPNDNYRQLINRVLRTVDTPVALAGKSQTNGRLNLDRAIRSTDNRPFNDDFATRARVTGGNLAIRGVNTGATVENGEPAIAGQSGGATLWWEWRAPTTGLVRMTTTGSNYDTLLAVFTGSALGALTPVASNDNDGAAITSRLEFSTVAGTTYQIVVAGKAAATGLTLLDIGSIPANDAFAGAQTITGRSTLVSGTNAQATLEPGEPQIRSRTGGKSLWYRWTSPVAGRHQFALSSEGFDPLLAVYTGSTLGDLRLIGSSDDADSEAGGGSTYTSAVVTVEAAAGTTYFIQVDGAARAGVPPITARFSLTLNDSTWTNITGGSVTNSPVIGPDGAVYVASSDGTLHAFNADGSRRWPALALNAQMDTSAAALAPDGTLYVATGPSFTQANSSRLHAFNSATGAKKWEILVGTSGNANNAVALGADGTIFVHSDSGRLHAFRDNQTSVSERWAVNVPGDSYASVALAPDGTLYLGNDDPNDNHRLFAINPSDGSTKWTFAADNPIYTTAAIDAAGNVYFGTLTSGRLYSVTSTGARRWVYAGASLGTSSSPALSPDGGTVYFAGYDGILHAVNTTTGSVRWTYRLGDQVRASSPAVDANGVVYVGCYDGLVYAIDADGRLVRTFATGGLIRSSPGIAGRTLTFGSNDGHVYAFDIGVGVGATNVWPQYRQNARRTGQRFSQALAVQTQPQSQAAVLGQSLSLSVVATGDGPITYQWRKDGVDITGATTAVITIGTVTATTAGRYTVAVISPTSSLMSTAADITVEPPIPGRLINLSVRTNAGTGDQILAVGFVLSGVTEKPMLVRAIGPTLASFGVTGVLADPRLQLFSGATPLAANDNWAAPVAGSVATVAAAFTNVGAFALPANSLDAAILRSVPVGAYSAQVSGAAGSGIALAEIYDAEPLAGARLINVSARAQVGTGASVLIAGFTISGNLPKQVLIRGVGPTLNTAFGVGGVLANPRLDVFRGSAFVSGNDDWGGSATLGAAFTQVGAFALPNASRDAVLLLTLPAGSYTAQVSGVGGTTGVALIEVYELP